MTKYDVEIWFFSATDCVFTFFLWFNSKTLQLLYIYIDIHVYWLKYYFCFLQQYFSYLPWSLQLLKSMKNTKVKQWNIFRYNFKIDHKHNFIKSLHDIEYATLVYLIVIINFSIRIYTSTIFSTHLSQLFIKNSMLKWNV